MGDGDTARVRHNGSASQMDVFRDGSSEPAMDGVDATDQSGVRPVSNEDHIHESMGDSTCQGHGHQVGSLTDVLVWGNPRQV